MPDEPSVFQQLMRVIQDRKANPPERSYTTKLFSDGTEKIGAKIIEEAHEMVEAALEAEHDASQRGQLVSEAGDLIYHLLVMLGHHRVSLPEVEAELARRFGVSGLDEKAARSHKNPKDNGY